MNDPSRKNMPPFSSNAMRLSVREWLGVFLALTILGTLAGPIWTGLEVFEPPVDYRIPYELSEDYWLFGRYCKEASESDKSFVFGDSFVWGQHVREEGTLSAHLNRLAGSELFVNAGLDGAHPLALEGLVENHCAGLRNRDVVLHLNLLWLSTPQADLRADRVPHINHPRLLPQFFPPIPGYQAPISEKLGIVLARHLPVLTWSRHIRSAYFSNAPLPSWTLANPHLNPLRQITLALPETADDPHPDIQPWSADGAVRQAPPWVELAASLQWQAFRRLVGTLQERGNRVFVLVGPLNEHMLDPVNAVLYRDILQGAESWLEHQGIPHFIPPVLPSDVYADLSHPLSQGYAILAQDLWEQLSG